MNSNGLPLGPRPRNRVCGPWSKSAHATHGAAPGRVRARAVTLPGAPVVAQLARALRWSRCGGIGSYSISEEGALHRA
jgi:hypothetical protein